MNDSEGRYNGMIGVKDATSLDYPMLDQKSVNLSSEALVGGRVFNSIRDSLKNHENLQNEQGKDRDEILVGSFVDPDTGRGGLEKIIINYKDGESSYYKNVLNVLKSMIENPFRHPMIPRYLQEFIVKEYSMEEKHK